MIFRLCKQKNRNMDSIFILFVGVVIVVGGIIGLKLHPFLALLMAALVVALLTPLATVEQFYLLKGSTAAEALKLAHKSYGERIATEFGNTCIKIGILIAMSAIIGKSMLESGAAERIIRAMLRLLGVQKAPIGFLLSGFFLTIPVFVDTVIFLMMPLAKAMGLRLGKNYLLLVLSVVAGAVMANSFVPPSPGPLFLVGALNVPIGLMMACGTLLGLCTITVGYFFAVWANKKFDIPVRDSADAKLEDIQLNAAKHNSELPPLWLALLPAVFPIVTICARSAVEAFTKPNVPITQFPIINQLLEVVLFFGDKNIALFAGALFALLVLARQKKTMKEGMTAFVQTALMSGGGIILITASGILSGMAQNANLGFNPVYLCLAIGAGAKLVPWMNDAGFWIMCKTSNLTEKEALQTIAPMQTLMGLTGLVLIMIAAQFFPMI